MRVCFVPNIQSASETEQAKLFFQGQLTVEVMYIPYGTLSGIKVLIRLIKPVVRSFVLASKTIMEV